MLYRKQMSRQISHIYVFYAILTPQTLLHKLIQTVTF